ncbi:MAG: biotin/lipoyl-binding protein [Flavobacterium sp.]
MRIKYALVVLSVLLVCCAKKNTVNKTANIKIAVAITNIDTTAISNYTDLNATTSYLIKNIIKANITGYLDQVNVASNDFVKKGKLLFSLKTKEAKVLGNTINKIDPSLHFGNAVNLNATSDGFVNAVNVQQGDYIQEGDALAIINDSKSFSIVLSLPYELKKYIKLQQHLDMYLPDGTIIPVIVNNFAPTVDPVSQTQNVILKCIKPQNIPENLIVKIRIIKKSGKTRSLPKAAVLSDETQTDFWVMKMTNDSTAVKIPIKKGIESDGRVEILSPEFSFSDKILITGNYGVSDTIKVKITK